MTDINLEKRLADALSCPIDWEEELQLKNWELNVLEYDWTYVLCKHTPSNEPLRFGDALRFEQLDQLDADEIEHGINVLLSSKPKALQEYMSRAGRLKGLSFFAPSSHGKHFVAALNREEAVQRSKNGISLFFEDYKSDDLAAQFWVWFLGVFEKFESTDQYFDWAKTGRCDKVNKSIEDLWNEFITLHQKRICMQCSFLIGAVAGTETPYLVYDLHFDSKTLHTYPVSREEAIRIMGDEDLIFYETYLGFLTH